MARSFHSTRRGAHTLTKILCWLNSIFERLLVEMEHRGFQYQVLQTIPKGWKWTADVGHNRTKSGVALYRIDAVRHAVAAIDRAFIVPSRERAGKTIQE